MASPLWRGTSRPLRLLVSESMGVFDTLRGKHTDEVIDVDAEVRQPRAAVRRA